MIGNKYIKGIIKLANTFSMGYSKSLRVSVIGACGYGGLQSIRLLREHPFVKITYLGGNKNAGNHWNQIYPYLPLDLDLSIEIPKPDKISELSDLAVLSLPNGLASQLAPSLLDRNVKVIDLSADYRYRSLELWKSIYVQEAQEYPRTDSELCKEAVYGLPEWNKARISSSRLISSP